MLKNYLITALRNLGRHRLYAFINIAGYALGLAVFLLIGLIVVNDLSYDRFHPGSDRVYRLLTQNRFSQNKNAITSGALTRASMESISGIVATTRAFSFGQIDLSTLGAADSEQGIQRRVIGTDSNFFKVFTGFTLLRGDPDKLLRAPGSAVVTPEVARALFGDEDPIGKQVESPSGPVTINGLVTPPPRNSHIQFDILLVAQVTDQNRNWWESWDNIAGHGYARVREGFSRSDLEQALQQLAKERGMNEQYRPLAQPLGDIHLHSRDLHYDMLNANVGDHSQVLVLISIAFMTLLISGINFVNLASARASGRAREVGMRKVVGASRAQLMSQFLGEAVLQTLVAMVIAAAAVQFLLLPSGWLIDRDLGIELFTSPGLLLGILLTSTLFGLLAGIYPALVLAGFRPVRVLKGDHGSSRGGLLLRRSLVVLQFAVSIGLIASVILVRQQLAHVSNLDRGYQVDRIAVIGMWQVQPASARAPFLEALRNYDGIEAVGSSQNLPGWTIPRFGGRASDATSPDLSITFDRMFVGADFLDAMEIELLEGRNFRANSLADSGRSVLINRSAALALGWENPIGKQVELESGAESAGRMMRTVVGVIEDIHLHDARQQVAPLIMEYANEPTGPVVVRLAGGAIGPTREWIEQTWQEIYPEQDFNSWFLERHFQSMYRQDRHFARIATIFSGFTILIAALGLFGLAAYMTSQRRREIAIRKVLGSGEFHVVTLLVRDFVTWVLVANLIAWPVAWLAMHRWLEDFVFRVSITPLPFLAAGLVALLIALLTVTGQAWRAALNQPAQVLRAD